MGYKKKIYYILDGAEDDEKLRSVYCLLKYLYLK